MERVRETDVFRGRSEYAKATMARMYWCTSDVGEAVIAALSTYGVHLTEEFNNDEEDHDDADDPNSFAHLRPPCRSPRRRRTTSVKALQPTPRPRRRKRRLDFDA